jgi:lysophospholipase L1-like esterase
MVLRLLVPPMAAGSAARFELDPELIYRLRPNATVTWSSAEFTETMRTNGRGLRGPAVGPRRPGVARLVAIGDSFTYGHGVQDDEAYPAVLARTLAARGHAVEVVNAGVPGYSTDQAYAWARRDGLALEPDLLLVGVHCSDLSDNHERPLYDVVDGRLMARAATATRLYRLGSVLGQIPSVVRESRTFELLVASFDWHEPPPAHPAAELEAWSRAKIRLAAVDLAARVPALAVVLMPCKRSLAAEPDPYGPLAGELAAAGIRVLAAAPALAAAAGTLAPLFFRDDPHLNRDGTAALGRVVADFVEAARLLPDRPETGEVPGRVPTTR